MRLYKVELFHSLYTSHVHIPTIGYSETGRKNETKELGLFVAGHSCMLVSLLCAHNMKTAREEIGRLYLCEFYSFSPFTLWTKWPSNINRRLSTLSPLLTPRPCWYFSSLTHWMTVKCRSGWVSNDQSYHNSILNDFNLCRMLSRHRHKISVTRHWRTIFSPSSAVFFCIFYFFFVRHSTQTRSK